eukprot:CAMPEP_0168539518 /NCGR_PEP_ID=MMETSP0405-20121227/21879_1 /TAXON_ID=498012 /ORGANISM="Trichosphaerium sp, Strain Am-I-7 wt" /LENGTH=350 /DNA_ID=CAMNT_0008569103 /DNA_START=169 /DNA_END=1217 /DNA_ORIENTATION=-
MESVHDTLTIENLHSTVNLQNYDTSKKEAEQNTQYANSETADGLEVEKSKSPNSTIFTPTEEASPAYEDTSDDDLFVVDTSKANIDLDGNAVKPWVVPLYSREKCDILGPKSEVKTSESVEHYCWNCGSKSHTLGQCQKPTDADRIATNQKYFNDAKYGYQSEEYERKFRPGLLSQQLMDALGIGEGDEPPYYYRIRSYGYPPCYIKDGKYIVEYPGLYDKKKDNKETLQTKNSQLSEPALCTTGRMNAEAPSFQPLQASSTITQQYNYNQAPAWNYGAQYTNAQYQYHQHQYQYQYQASQQPYAYSQGAYYPQQAFSMYPQQTIQPQNWFANLQQEETSTNTNVVDMDT